LAQRGDEISKGKGRNLATPSGETLTLGQRGEKGKRRRGKKEVLARLLEFDKSEQKGPKV